MSKIEQDAVLGSLIRQQKELQRERAAINIALAGFSSKLSNLADLLSNDKYSAMAALKDLGIANLAAMLDDFSRVDTASAQCGRDIAALDI